MFSLLQDKNICVSLVKMYICWYQLCLRTLLCVFFPQENKQQNTKSHPFVGETLAPPIESSTFDSRQVLSETNHHAFPAARSQPLGVGNSLKWTARLSSRNCPKKDMNHLNQPSTFRGFAVSFRKGRSKWVLSLVFLWNQKSKKMSVLGRFSFLLLGELNE